MKHFLKCLVILWLFQAYSDLKAEDGYRLWLRYDKIEEASLLRNIQHSFKAG